jgi:AcrR family transcriptional regulator
MGSYVPVTYNPVTSDAPMPAQTTRLSAEERREQLLDATKAIVARDGFHAVSIEAVAREAGITRPIVYGHFRDLQGLLEALVEREGRRALSQLATVLPENLATGDPREQLIAALTGYLEAVRSDPETWRLVLMPQEGAPQILQRHVTKGRQAVVAALAQAMQPGLGIGPTHPSESPDPELTARTLSAVADEAARLLLTDPQRYPVQRLVAHARWVLWQLGS